MLSIFVTPIVAHLYRQGMPRKIDELLLGQVSLF